MASHQPLLSVRFIVEGSKYKINVRRPAHENLRDISRIALTQHLAAIFGIDEDDAESMVDGGSIKVIWVQEEDGSILRLSDTVKESGLSERSLLRIKLKISDDELSERVRSLSLAHADDSPHLISGSLKSGSLSPPNRNQERPTSDLNFILEMRINGSTSKVGVGSGELLRDVCRLAIVKHIRKLHQLNKEDAVAMVESQQIKVLSVEAAGETVEVLDLDETVFRNGLSGGATLNITLTGLTNDPPLSDDGIAKPSLEPSISSQTFQPDDIRKATNNYSKQNIVGKGGQATVYKCSLHGCMVAVKKYQSLDFTDMEREIKVLQKVRHPNVILLMGYCREEKVIISEFMEGGSLEDRLRDKPERLSWFDRNRVAQEIASAIYFLHHCDILHRDLKPANILFDSHGTTKVADMGLAKLSAATMSASARVGTPGYMDPSVYHYGNNSKSMDVYSLGLIILQICTHKESVDDIHDIFRKVPKGQKRNSKFVVDLLKESMVAFDSSNSEVMALMLLEVGLQCAEEDSRDRPTLEEVIRNLRRVETDFTAASDVTRNNSSIDTMTLTVSINGHSSKIGVGSGELLRDVCQSAIVSHIKKIHQLEKEDAVAMVESQQINALSVEAAGEVLDLDDTVFRNGLSGGATLNITLTELTSEPLSDDGMAKHSISSQTFQPDDIKKATNNYSKQNMVGKGGQATVYKCSLYGSMVAVKKYHNFLDMELEIKVLQKVRHPNVIILVGYCQEEKVVITEFMEGGSLQDRLHEKPEKLSWSDRFRVAQEIASAISYLHHCDILHRDLKPSCILFDSRGTAKVAGMGLATLSASSMTTSSLVGTIWSIDPWHPMSRKTSKSMDVRALGLIILQLCTHKESVDDIRKKFYKVQLRERIVFFGVDLFKEAMVDLFKEAMVAFDSSLPSEEMALTLLEVGLQCARDRPTLEEVIRNLRRVETDFTAASG